MSRVGKHPIILPSGVTCNFKEQVVSVKGKLGELSFKIPDSVKILFEEGKIILSPLNDSKLAHSLWGTTRSVLDNLVTGVHAGFSINLEIEGVGYRAAVQGNVLKLNLGYSHEINFSIPEGIHIKCEKPTSISISGVDKQKVGQVAAKIKSFRPPEPYKGKGIRKQGEFILRKEGKKR